MISDASTYHCPTVNCCRSCEDLPIAEVAATATALGITDVTLVDPVRVPLGRVLNPEVAERFGRLHSDHGATTRFGTAVTGVEAVESGLVVGLDDGTRLPAATVVVGIGAVPNDGWVRGSGLTVADGDRVVHNITHPDDLRAHEPVEYIWTDQYDRRIQLVGRTGGNRDHVTLSGDDPERDFAVLYTDSAGEFAGAVTASWPRALIACRKALRTPVSLDAVRDAITGASRGHRPADTPGRVRSRGRRGRRPGPRRL